MGAWFRQHTYTTSRRIDDYLSENLPELIEANQLATKSEITDVGRLFERYESEAEKLDEWSAANSTRMEELEQRIRRLELKKGVAEPKEDE